MWLKIMNIFGTFFFLAVDEFISIYRSRLALSRSTEEWDILVATDKKALSRVSPLWPLFDAIC